MRIKCCPKAALKAVGKFLGLFTAVEVIKFAQDLCKLATYKEAVANNYGIINIIYNSAYNGSWYVYYGEDTWTTTDTVYLPASTYGTGVYTSN